MKDSVTNNDASVSHPHLNVLKTKEGVSHPHLNALKEGTETLQGQEAGEDQNEKKCLLDMTRPLYSIYSSCGLPAQDLHKIKSGNTLS